MDNIPTKKAIHQMWRKIKVLLWKNFIIRKNHWLLTFIECFFPIVLFLVMGYARSNVSGLNKVYVNESTYHNVDSLKHIYSQLRVGSVKLWYAPYNNSTKGIIKKVQLKLGFPGETIKGFDNTADMVSYKEFKHDSSIAAVIFSQADNVSLDYDLTIYNKDLNWNTDKLFMPLITSQEKKHPEYVIKGFAALQLAIDISYIEQFSKNVQIPTFSLQQFPDPPHIEDSKLNNMFVYFLPAITVFAFILLCPAVLQRVGEEKASGAKELLKMTGLKSSQIWFGWFVYALETNLFSIIVIVILMKVRLWGVPYSLIEHSDGTVLFVFLFLYCIAGITLCFLIANIFKKPFIATVFGILFWIISHFLPNMFGTSFSSTIWKFKIIFYLVPNVVLYFGYSSISIYEMREIGVQWNNLFEQASGSDEDVTMGIVFILLIFQSIVFMLLTLYIEKVSPGEYGIPKQYFFPFKPIIKMYKRFFCKKKRENVDEKQQPEKENLEKKTIPSIQINNLKKKYGNCIAIDRLNFAVETNNIAVLLGENGAGKSTVMSILTGMINATSGSVLINKKDIRKHTEDVREMMGLCPQHNLLFTDLTVYEHLYFFAKLRDLENPKDAIDKILNKLDLYESKNFKPHILSGGMKRKLCLALALIGNPKVLILDEPTSGMDPKSRRKVWNLLIEYKKTGTILISTHFMNEAEAIGDKIIIMANGCVLSEGSSLELRKKYNTGYNFSLELKSKKSLSEISNAVREHFRGATVKQETNNLVVYLLPFFTINNYSRMHNELKENPDIININIISSTIKDVFIKAKDENDGYLEDTGYRLCVLLKSTKHIYNIRRTVMSHFPDATLLLEKGKFVVYFLPTNETTEIQNMQSLIVNLKKRQERLEIAEVTGNVTLKNYENHDVINENNTVDNSHLCLLFKSARFNSLIKNKVKEHFPKALVNYEDDFGIVYLLPKEESDEYKNLIKTLEEKKIDWDIFSINMDVTVKGVHFKVKDENVEDETNNVTKLCEPIQEVNLLKIFLALLIKRLYSLKHTYRWLLLTILVVNLIFLLAILLTVSNTNVHRSSEPTLNYLLKAYGNTKVFCGTNTAKNDSLCNFYAKSVQHQSNAMTEVSGVSNAIISEGLNNFAFYKKHMIAAADFNSTANNDVLINAMYSSEALHSIPIAINLATNSIVKFLINENVYINIQSTPIKPLATQLTPQELSVLDVSSIWLMLIPISFFFFGCYFIVFPHSEVSTNFIRQQTNCGIRLWIYWSINLIFDLILVTIQAVLVVTFLYLVNLIYFNSNGFSHSDIWTFFTIFEVYTITSLPYTYLFSYQETVSDGIKLFFTINLSIGTVFTLIVNATKLSTSSNYAQLLEYLITFLTIISPPFALGNIITKFSKKYVENFNWNVMDPNKKHHICKTEPNSCCVDSLSNGCVTYQSYFENENLGIQYEFCLMLVTLAFYFLVLLMLNNQDWSIFKNRFKNLTCRKSSPNVEESEQMEELVIEKTTESSVIKTAAVIVKNLTKIFRKKVIVNSLNFEMIKNQCFGLLGVNGAGKSTTFAMLTKYLHPDKGTIKLQEKNNKIINFTDFEYTKKIGYCSQKNTLNFYLTGRQLLFTMSLLRGYSWESSKQMTANFLKKFGLTKEANKQCIYYSGGNKRKLNTSLAFLGNPQVIFLDEPTSGVDPANQRNFWRILSTSKKLLTSTFLLCSHSMEECENLCEEIAILENGQFNTKGSVLDLKRNLQEMYKITMILKKQTKAKKPKQAKQTNQPHNTKHMDKEKQANVQEDTVIQVKNVAEIVRNRVAETLGGELKEQYGDTLIFEVTTKSPKDLFTELVSIQKKHLSYILVVNMTLEDVFLIQTQDNDNDNGKSLTCTETRIE